MEVFLAFKLCRNSRRANDNVNDVKANDMLIPTSLDIHKHAYCVDVLEYKIC